MDRTCFQAKWLKTFARNIAKKDLLKYVNATGNYIWHIFSWELLSKDQYLCGDDARKAYDAIEKSDAIYIDWFNNNATKPLTCDLYTAKALDAFIEVYVTDRSFNWTYIKTHESTCGPYFFRK